MSERDPLPPLLADDLGFLLVRCSVLALRGANAALEPAGLKPRLFALLAACAGGPGGPGGPGGGGPGGGAPQRHLAAVLGLDPSVVVSLVDELEERGLVERVPDPGDRRTKLVTPTVAGAELVADAAGRIAAAQRATFAGWDDADRERLVALLRRTLATLAET